MQIETDILKQCRFLVGPTGCGKSDTALLLADALGAEIVSLDSMAVYRGMDIGTAKPSRAARDIVPHHLLDVVDPHEEYSLADYVQAAESACREILSRGKVPLFVGGTGLYLRGILRGVFDGPPADWEFRGQMQALAEAESGELHRRLRQVDPESAAHIHPHDIRRVIRALEVHRLTGRPLSEQQRQHPLPENQRPRHVNWLSPPRDWLYHRIDRRVDDMLTAGLLEEVQNLLAADRPMCRTARQALGYKELIDHLSGETSLNEAIMTIKSRTRQFAKRQHTWFRNLVECRPVAMTGDESPAELTERLLQSG